MASAGSKPGKGWYWCRKCGKMVTLDHEDEDLPECPACGHREYVP